MQQLLKFGQYPHHGLWLEEPVQWGLQIFGLFLTVAKIKHDSTDFTMKKIS